MVQSMASAGMPVSSAMRVVPKLQASGLEVEPAVPVEADRAVGVGEKGLEVIEVAGHLLVDGAQPLGEAGGHAGEPCGVGRAPPDARSVNTR
jgi:hypothetical protein